ncbi:sulfotransferase domain-containing protein [uncultured Umboniibacter sp.]|uniref:sulfotransferase domain-containing protein n=1 Tax=uncultured Umboniibacter sp. TaxID=1798917 RepID=UPI002606C70F|nr:sulfotransferase domain-containing protein [uncultured Umboniibacter sp.]
MSKFDLVSLSGVNYTINTPEPTRSDPSAYLFAYAKSGSTLMDRLVREYCGAIKQASFSLFGEAFQQGVRPQDIGEDASVCFADTGIVYTGFRSYPLSFKLNLKPSKNLILVRDPRDMLVSLYYSIAKSHVALNDKDGSWQRERQEVQSKQLNEFVLERSFSYAEYFKWYGHAFQGVDVKVVRYEDIIYKKLEWMVDLVNWLGLPLDMAILEKVVAKHDVLPEAEDEGSHIRQVHPGNYKAKLERETIMKLNRRLITFLETYGYDDIFTR